MYAKYARTARKTLQKMLTIKEITSIIMHHLPSIQIEDCGSVDLTAYRFRYALSFLLYHTTRKMSNHSFRCFCKNKYDLSAVCQAKTDLTNQRKMHKKREPASTADDLLSRKRLKKNAGQCHRRFLLFGKESCCRTVCF